MTTTSTSSTSSPGSAVGGLPTLVTAGTGKTGRRVARRLLAAGVPTRAASRSTTPTFDWEEPATWVPALDGMQAAYLAYVPDLAFPGAVDTVGRFVRLAGDLGVRRLVLLSGRGEPAAQEAEEAVLASGIPATVVRAAFFMQDFSEHFLLGPVLDGVIALPAGDVREPFVDAEDVADVAAAALLDDRHAGAVYEVTGPRLLGFADAAAEIGAATGRTLAYVPASAEEYADGAIAAGVPPEEVEPLLALFGEVLDGRNATLADGVQAALGRPARDFAAYARRTAATGIWATTAEEVRP